MAKEFNVSIGSKYKTDAPISTFTNDAQAYSQALAHRDIHTTMGMDVDGEHTTAEIFIPRHAIAYAILTESENNQSAPEDAVCNGGE